MKEKLKALFFTEALRKWHFEQLIKESKISRERVNTYLKELLKEKLILRKKEKGKMPYYLAQTESDHFRQEKRLYGLRMLEKSGLFEYLNSLPEIKTAIIFGSFSRGDWNKSSDVDLFIYGNIKKLNIREIRDKLKKEIQLFGYNNSDEIKKELAEGVIANIVKGFNIKNSLEPFEVKINV
ncbi:MAG: nucleotidyltransferase domain-containing protein [Nanoarchaeota archaeon]